MRRTHPLAWLRPAPAIPLVTVPAGPTASAQRRDGALRPVWGARYVAADLPLDAAARARAFAVLLPAGGIVARRAAAWVHTGEHCPDALDVILPHPRRDRPGAVRTHVARLREGDVVSPGGVPTTSRDATLLDVLRWEPEAMALKVARSLLDAGADAHAVTMRLGGMYREANTVRAADLLLAVTGGRTVTAESATAP